MPPAALVELFSRTVMSVSARFPELLTPPKLPRLTVIPVIELGAEPAPKPTKPAPLKSIVVERAPAPVTATGLFAVTVLRVREYVPAGSTTASPVPEPELTLEIACRYEQIPPIQPDPAGSPVVLTS